jgi:hypothetical protein
MYAYRSMVRIAEDLYEIKRIFLESSVKDVEPVKEWLGCSHAFRKDGYLFLCSVIEDVEIIEETNDFADRVIVTEMKCTVIETIYPDPVPEETLETKSIDNE